VSCYNNSSSKEEVCNCLREKCGYSLIQFENSLHEIHTYYKLINRKRSISETRNKIEYLESTKDQLVNKIDEFLTKAKSWGWIKNQFTDITEWTDEEKANFIRTKFQLHHYFDFIDLRINRLNRIISIIESIHFHATDKRKILQIETVMGLVWILVFRNSRLTIKKSIAETKSLLRWFSENREYLSEELSDLYIYKGEDALRRSYERYIQSPSEANKEYREMAELLYQQCFEDIHKWI